MREGDPLKRPWSRGEKVVAAIFAAAVLLTLYGALRYPYPRSAPLIRAAEQRQNTEGEAPASLLGRRYR